MKKTEAARLVMWLRKYDFKGRQKTPETIEAEKKVGGKNPELFYYEAVRECDRQKAKSRVKNRKVRYRKRKREHLSADELRAAFAKRRLQKTEWMRQYRQKAKNDGNG